MLILALASVLLHSGSTHLIESRYYGSNVGDTSWLDKGRSIGEGSYETYGQVVYEDDIQGYNDGYSGRYGGGRGRYGASETCPYDNIERRSRGKRETIENESDDDIRNTNDIEATKKDDVESLFLSKLRRKRHDDYLDRGRDYRRDGYYRRDYRRDYYGRDGGDYHGRGGGDYHGRGGVVVARDRCGREACEWEAELVCDRDGRAGRSYYDRDRGHYDGRRDRGYYDRDRGYYGRDDRYRNDDYDVTWVRVNDAYYPRGKYNDLQEYLGSRLVGDARGSTLVIRGVKAEDKGTYRCYNAQGEFREVNFYPKYPLDSNEGC